jgi:hypothetical protein
MKIIRHSFKEILNKIPIVNKTKIITGWAEQRISQPQTWINVSFAVLKHPISYNLTDIA